MSNSSNAKADAAARFQVFRVSNAALYDEHTMEMTGMTPVVADGVKRFIEAGAAEGGEVRTVFSMPGLSLSYAWFKSGYPLPLHSHNADCVYYIIAGSLEIGTERLGPGEGFFVGSDVPYTYRSGPQGVELLEFRPADTFDIRFLGKTASYWQNIVAAMDAERGRWRGQIRPAEASAAYEIATAALDQADELFGAPSWSRS